MSQATSKPADDDRRAAIVGTAFIRAGELLNLTNEVLGNIIGLSASSVSRLRGGDSRLLAYGSKQRELATLFLRFYRSLDAILGGDDVVSAKWLRVPNTVLADAPINLIQTAQGLIRVVDYLDSRRAVA